MPCTHALLAKWIPPNERSRVGAAVYSGAQFGTVISMPMSGLLAEYGFDGGWPSIFYIFGLVGVVWSLAFVFLIYEDPEHDPKISEKERKYITNALWGSSKTEQVSLLLHRILGLFYDLTILLKFLAIFGFLACNANYRIFQLAAS